MSNTIQIMCPNATEQQMTALGLVDRATLGTTQTNSSLPKQLSVSEYSILTEFFFNQSVISVGWYSFLPKLHLRPSAKSCLQATLFATSCFLAANQFRDLLMAQKATRRYGVALQAINAAIADPMRAWQDETLVSILLLNVLDDITGESSFGSYSHLEGCAQLIKQRQDSDFQTEHSEDLAHSIVMQIQPAILEGHRSQTSTVREELIGKWLYGQSRPSPAVRILSFCFQISRLGKMIQEALAGATAREQDGTVLLIMLLEDGMNLEKRMADWHRLLDERWERKTSASKTMDGVLLDYYSDIQVAKTWNHWRVARIVLHDSLLDAISSLQLSARGFQGSLDILQANSSAIITRMVSEISASIPYHLQQVDEKGRATTQTSQRVLGGRALMWPLKMVLQCKWSAPFYKQEAMETLQFISDVLGIKQAIKLQDKTLERSA
ncbi:hypothetical protein VHEMI04141 [[Torrubiella] hemipterigena]|nr:hypothetical protein VHEMI04141 [[Torrubiella] hemipterigena]